MTSAFLPDLGVNQNLNKRPKIPTDPIFNGNSKLFTSDHPPSIAKLTVTHVPVSFRQTFGVDKGDKDDWFDRLDQGSLVFLQKPIPSAYVKPVIEAKSRVATIPLQALDVRQLGVVLYDMSIEEQTRLSLEFKESGKATTYSPLKGDEYYNTTKPLTEFEQRLFHRLISLPSMFNVGGVMVQNPHATKYNDGAASRSTDDYMAVAFYKQDMDTTVENYWQRSYEQSRHTMIMPGEHLFLRFYIHVIPQNQTTTFKIGKTEIVRQNTSNNTQFAVQIAAVHSHTDYLPKWFMPDDGNRTIDYFCSTTKSFDTELHKNSIEHDVSKANIQLRKIVKENSPFVPRPSRYVQMSQSNRCRINSFVKDIHVGVLTHVYNDGVCSKDPVRMDPKKPINNKQLKVHINIKRD